jgi:hypothetical protein
VADNFTGLVEFLPAALIGLHRASERQPAGLHPRQLLMTGMLTLWSLRLGLFLLGRMFSRSGPVRHPLSLPAIVSGVLCRVPRSVCLVWNDE